MKKHIYLTLAIIGLSLAIYYGYRASVLVNMCIPSSCGDDTMGSYRVCTTDCGGGKNAAEDSTQIAIGLVVMAVVFAILSIRAWRAKH